MLNWIKALFCQHDLIFVRNIYGDEIIACGYKRSLLKCRKCGKIRLMNFLIQTEAERALSEAGAETGDR